MELSVLNNILTVTLDSGSTLSYHVTDVQTKSNDNRETVTLLYPVGASYRELIIKAEEVTSPVLADYNALKAWFTTNLGEVLDLTPVTDETDKITSIKTETDKTPATIVKIDAIKTGSDKIDSATTLGLAGTNNSLAYRVHEIEKHFHNNEKWFGKSADQSGVNKWAKSVSESGMPTSFRAISGTADFGADANDEALVWGLYDTMGTDTKLDLHQIFITAASTTTLWIVRIIYGSGTMADAITAGQFTEIPIIADAAQNGSIDVILKLMMPRTTIGTHKIWVQAKNATNNATIDFIVGGHSYIA